MSDELNAVLSLVDAYGLHPESEYKDVVEIYEYLWENQQVEVVYDRDSQPISFFAWYRADQPDIDDLALSRRNGKYFVVFSFWVDPEYDGFRFIRKIIDRYMPLYIGAEYFVFNVKKNNFKLKLHKIRSRKNE